jgi:hypothetical protein
MAADGRYRAINIFADVRNTFVRKVSELNFFHIFCTDIDV